jgi:hypothetical protein
MINGKLATLKNWLKTLVLSPCSIARGDGTPPSTQTTAVVYSAQVVPQNYGIWVSLNQCFFLPFLNYAI